MRGGQQRFLSERKYSTTLARVLDRRRLVLSCAAYISAALHSVPNKLKLTKPNLIFPSFEILHPQFLITLSFVPSFV